MSELMEVYEPGDRFVTMTKRGVARMWTVREDGIPESKDYTAIERPDESFAALPPENVRYEGRPVKDNPQA